MEKITEEQRNGIYQQVEHIINSKKKNYNRILTSEEKEYLETDSYGYLLSLYYHGTIDDVKLENLIHCCISIAVKLDEQLSLKKTKSLVDKLLFHDNVLFHIQELIPFLNIIIEQTESEIVN